MIKPLVKDIFLILISRSLSDIFFYIKLSSIYLVYISDVSKFVTPTYITKTTINVFRKYL